MEPWEGQSVQDDGEQRGRLEPTMNKVHQVTRNAGTQPYTLLSCRATVGLTPCGLRSSHISGIDSHWSCATRYEYVTYQGPCPCSHLDDCGMVRVIDATEFDRRFEPAGWTRPRDISFRNVSSCLGTLTYIRPSPLGPHHLEVVLDMFNANPLHHPLVHLSEGQATAE